MSYRVGRFTAGFLAAVIGGSTTAIAAIATSLLGGSLGLRDVLIIFFGASAGVLWLGDRYGLMAPPYRDSAENQLSLKDPNRARDERDS